MDAEDGVVGARQLSVLWEERLPWEEMAWRVIMLTLPKPPTEGI